MTTILGISAFYHDSAAALVRDGEIVAANQEERFTRKKHDPAFPARAIESCLQSASITPAEIDYVCFYEKPIRKFERLLETYLAFAPSGFSSFAWRCRCGSRNASGCRKTFAARSDPRYDLRSSSRIITKATRPAHFSRVRTRKQPF